MTGPARDPFARTGRPTAQPVSEGVPSCWRGRDDDDGAACALAYTPEMQQHLLSRSSGCEGCWAGVNAAWHYYSLKERRL